MMMMMIGTFEQFVRFRFDIEPANGRTFIIFHFNKF